MYLKNQEKHAKTLLLELGINCHHKINLNGFFYGLQKSALLLQGFVQPIVALFLGHD